MVERILRGRGRPRREGDRNAPASAQPLKRPIPSTSDTHWLGEHRNVWRGRGRWNKATALGLQRAPGPGISVKASGSGPHTVTSERRLQTRRPSWTLWPRPPSLKACFSFPLQAFAVWRMKEELSWQWSQRPLCEGQRLRCCYFLTFIKCQWHAELRRKQR